MHCVSKEKCFWIQPYRAQLSLPQRKGAAEEYASDDDDARSEGSFDSTPHTNCQILSESDRCFCSPCSSVDSELEMDPGTSGEDSDVAAVEAAEPSCGPAHAHGMAE